MIDRHTILIGRGGGDYLNSQATCSNQQPISLLLELAPHQLRNSAKMSAVTLLVLVLCAVCISAGTIDITEPVCVPDVGIIHKVTYEVTVSRDVDDPCNNHSVDLDTVLAMLFKSGDTIPAMCEARLIDGSLECNQKRNKVELCFKVAVLCEPLEEEMEVFIAARANLLREFLHDGSNFPDEIDGKKVMVQNEGEKPKRRGRRQAKGKKPKMDKAAKKGKKEKSNKPEKEVGDDGRFEYLLGFCDGMEFATPGNFTESCSEFSQHDTYIHCNIQGISLVSHIKVQYQ